MLIKTKKVLRINQEFKPSSIGAMWVLLALGFNTFSYILPYTLGLPRFLLYIGDILILWLLILCAFTNRRNKYNKVIIFLMTLWAIWGIISSIINFENPLLIFWGIRNNWRFFVFFYACTIYLKSKDIQIIFKVLWIVFWISIPLCTLERFCVSYPEGTIIGDMIGGVFWNYSGCNLPFNVILCLCTIDGSSRYFRKEIKSSLFFIICLSALYMSATAELKVFIVEFVLIILLSALYNRITLKTILAIVVGSLLFSSVISVFIALNAKESSSYGAIYTIEGFIEYATRESGYDGTGDLNRLTGIKTVATSIFNNDIIKILFGIGLGNGEYTNFFISPFYQQYFYLHYQWFHAIWMFIELGLIGIILYSLIFVDAFLKILKVKINSNQLILSKVSLILMMILFFYNNTLRSEGGGFLLYSILAIPYILLKEESNKY